MALSETVVAILKLGLSGLVFLLAFLGYRLIRAEQRRDKPAEHVLGAVSKYMWQAILLSVIVAVFTIWERSRESSSSRDREILADCRNELETLRSQSELDNLTLNDLRNLVSVKTELCLTGLEGRDQ